MRVYIAHEIQNGNCSVKSDFNVFKSIHRMTEGAIFCFLVSRYELAFL